MATPSYDLYVEVADGVSGVDVDALERLVARILQEESVEADAGLSLLLADDALLQQLNRDHRGRDEPTDVLSFGAEEGEAAPRASGEPRYLGDIAVSVERVRVQAAEAGLGLAQELAHVVLHGVLHLLGYDHERPEDDARMREREESVLGPGIHEASRHSDD
jgi:probable rRNA maturation factor